MLTRGMCVLALACCAGPATADLIVYGISDIALDTSQLFTLNVTTGDLNLVGSPYPGLDIEGIAVYGGPPAGGDGQLNIVGHTGGDGELHDFVNLNFTTGVVSVIGPVAPGDEFKGLASTGDGTIWGFVENQGWGTINGTGDFSLLHASALAIESVAITSNGDTLYGTTDDGRLYEVDAGTGDTTLLVDLDFNDDIENLEMLSDTELAFFTEGPDGVTFNVFDLVTGGLDQTLLEGIYIEDIESFVIIPAPGALALLLLAGLMTSGRRRAGLSI